MNTPLRLRTSRTSISILTPSRLHPLVRLSTIHRAFHSSPKPQLIHTLLDSAHDLFTNLHTITHLSWALTIPLSALLIRLSITLPLSLYTRRVQQQQLYLQPLLLSWSHHLRRQNMSRSSHRGPAIVERDTKRDIRVKRRELYHRWGCQNWKSFLPAFQLPIWLLMVETIRAMAGTHRGLLGIMFSSSRGEIPPPAILDASTAVMTDSPSSLIPLSLPLPFPPDSSLATEGALWFPDLTVPDPLLILPFTLSASMLLNLYMTSRRGRALISSSPPSGSKPSPLQRRISHILGIIALAAGPLTLQMPSAMLLYWISSSLMGYVQALVLDWWVPMRYPPPACKVRISGEGRGEAADGDVQVKQGS